MERRKERISDFGGLKKVLARERNLLGSFGLVVRLLVPSEAVPVQSAQLFVSSSASAQIEQ